MEIIMDQKEYWDSVSETKKFTTPFQAEEFSAFVRKSDLIVDIGCGYGRTLNELYHAGYTDLLGIDFSEKMINRGREQFPYLNFAVKKDDTIELADNSVDAVILFAVLTCIVDDNEQRQLIREITRVLKPNGILYVNDFLLNDDARNIERYEKYRSRFGVYGAFELPEGAVVRHHSEKWIKELLCGFSVLRYEHLIFTTMNGHKSNGFYFIGSKT